MLRRLEQPQPGPLGQFFLRTEQPRCYWAGTVIPPRIMEGRRPLQVLILASPSLSGGGLFVDYTPWVLAGCGVLVLSALLWLPFVRGITRNVREMSRTTEGIAVGRFESRVASRRNDELGRLAESINDMAGRLEGFVTGQRRFLGDIAHELCSPLARIQTALGILEQRAEVKEQPYVNDLQEEAEHMSQLVGELLSFSKASMNRSKVRLEATRLVEPVANAVRREQVDGVAVEQKIPDDLTAVASAELLQRALANLLRNAIRHAGPAGPITITGRRDGQEAVLEVADRGPGVPEESLPRLFDPFYRVDESRTRDTGGVGLGLTIVKTCVESCGGTVSAANRPEGGLKVEIRLKAVAVK
jgi:two-component system sensor histidine kinase CpxA